MGTWYTNQNPIGMLITVLKNRVADEEGGEWSAPEMIDGSLAFFLWGKRGWWNCGADRHGPDGCGIKDQEGFWLSVQSFSSGACPPFPTSFEEAASSPHVPRARMWLEPGIDHSTKIFLDADKEYQSLFETLVSALVDPVQEEHRSVREDNAQQQEIVAPSDSKPWEKVPEGKDREFARLWYEDISSDEIAARLDYADAKAVGTQASRLRKIFGKEVIPMRRNEGRWGMYHLEKD